MNNPILFNAAISGATGGIHERWITDENSSGYIAVRNQILIFATEVDLAIPIDANTSISDAELLQSIVQGVLADRYLLNITVAGIQDIAQSIAALYAAQRTIVIPGLNFPISSDDVTNDSTVPGTTVTDALDDIQDQLDETSTTTLPTGTTVFTVEADLPAGNNQDWILDGAGGGGASGMAMIAANNSVGGSGGGAGARCIRTFTRAQLVAALPITVFLPLGGAGGASVVGANLPGLTGANGGAVVPNPGVGASVIGTGLSMFAGSGAGAQGTTVVTTNRSGGAGGGWHGNGIANASGSDAVGGLPRAIDEADDTNNKDAFNGYGGAGSIRTGSLPGGSSIYGGAAGGVSSAQTAAAAGGAGGSSTFASGGGGGAGSFANAGSVRSDGGAGGSCGPTASGLVAGGGGTAGVGAGVSGGNGAAATATRGGQGGGGGAANVVDAVSGNGGNGGNGGGGGGGGGAAKGTVTATSGAGGNGGNASLIIIGRL